MKKHISIILTGFLLLINSIAVFSQELPRFWNEIQAFKKQDSIHFPGPDRILFTGSSSIRLWKTLEKDFAGYPVLNRGFGGSTLPDLIHYTKDIIAPYKLKQIVIFCGENDFAESDTVTSQGVMKRFEILFHLIRKYHPGISIVYISIKPSPRRARLHKKMAVANRLIRNFLSKHSNTVFVDVYHKMLKDGKPRKDLFVEDQLHMNAKGYAIWTKAIRPHLLK